MKIKQLSKDVVNYINVGIVANVGSGLALCSALESITNENWGNLARDIVLAGVNAKVGYSKYKEYSKVKKRLEKEGWNIRTVKPKMYSWCQRHASRQAAKQTGHIEEFDEFAAAEGHKGYHLLPKYHRIKEIRA